MQYTTIVLGSLILLFALVTLIGSVKSPDELVRLKYMRAKMGNKVGTLVHTLVYVVVPLIFGFFMTRAGINGVSLVDFITR
jgi:predicted acyltransferase